MKRLCLISSPTFRLLAMASLVMPPPALSAAYELVWQDEFNQPDGTAPDPANWSYDIGGWGWGNAEEQYYTDSRHNSRIENNQLVIEMHRDTANEYPNNGYTSARLLTKGKQEWTYGRFEARIRLPYGGSGLWPAFWMLGGDIDSVGWPSCGEIDIMEYVSRIPDEIFGTIHGPGYSGGASFGSTLQFTGPVAPPQPPNLPDPYDPSYYHVYTVEWEPERIRWYVDGILYHVAVPSDIAPNTWVFDHSHFIILNLAIGGNFGGFINTGDLTFPTQMLVDWVRVYQMEQPEPTALDIPGIIQAEDYFAQSGVQTESCSDIGGGLNVGFLDDGNWMDFALNTPTAGRYAVDLRVASGASVTGQVEASVEGRSVTSPDISNTGGWQSWTTLRAGEIDLPKGPFNLRLTIHTPGPSQDALNLNWMEFKLLEAYPDYGVFAGFPVTGFWAETGNYLGDVYLENYPWVYLRTLQQHAYAASPDESGAWFFIPAQRP